jgi:carboxylesterase
MAKKQLVNAHLAGGPFYFQGGPNGVLLVHGLTATTAEVRPLAEYLRGAGYTVAGPLLPGHGTQSADLNRVKWQDWARSVEETYALLRSRCGSVAVGGESTGAVLTLHLAAQHPEIAAVLSYAPALKLALSRPVVAAGYALSVFGYEMKPKPGPPAESDALWQGYDTRPTRGARELLRLQRATRPLLPKITQPILIMQGKLDRTVDPAAPQEIYDKVRSKVKELHWLDRSTHCVALDCERRQLFEVTRQFLERAFTKESGA